MKALLTAFLIGSLGIAAPALAQSAPPATAAIDPVRLAEARTLIGIMMPPVMREQMIGNLVTSISQTMAQAMLEDPAVKRVMAERPGAREVVLRFLERQRQYTMAEMRTNLPGMLEAMAKAYARRFTVPEMREMAAFFGTPTGQRYIAESATIFSDPDIAGWMKETMRRSMDRMPGEVAKLHAELDALD